MKPTPPTPSPQAPSSAPGSPQAGAGSPPGDRAASAGRPGAARLRGLFRSPAALVAFVVAVGLLAGVGTVYLRFSPGGTGAAPEAAPWPAAEAGAGAGHNLSPEQLQRMIDQVSARVSRDPADANAWALLAHSLEMIGRIDEASEAYAKLAALRPEDPQVLADYADALAMRQGRRFDGEPSRLIDRALARDPDHVKALSLAGARALEAGRRDEAIRLWERARAGAEPKMARALDLSLARVRGDGAPASAPAGEEPPHPGTGVRPGGAPAAGLPAGAAGTATASGKGVAAAVSGRLSIAPALRSKVGPDDAVFLFARAPDAKMPTLLLRARAGDLPMNYTLDDSHAMVPGNSLSGLGQVVVGARISREGEVRARPGDLQGVSKPVAPGAKGVDVQIAEVLK